MKKTEYERYCELRDKYGYKDSDVAKGSGVSKSTFSDWKAGRYTPKTDKMVKIASFLGVSVEYLTTGEEKENETYYLNEETAKMAQAIFENKELRGLFDTAKDSTPEDIQTVHSMLLALKRKERGDLD